MSTGLATRPRTPAGPAERSITVRPAPRREPPFDDEIIWPQLHVAGPLDRPLPFAPAARRERVPLPSQSESARTGLPDPAQWGRRLLIGIIETAGGRRPLHQIAALLSTGVAAGLGADFERAGRARTPHWTHTATVRSVRATEPVEGVAELSATVQAGTRVRAVALRLEVRAGRWRCTRLVLG